MTRFFKSALDGRSGNGTPSLARKAISIAAAQRFADLAPGQSITFELPDRQPAKRDAAAAINSVAWRVLGKGRYRVATVDGSFVVTRLESVL